MSRYAPHGNEHLTKKGGSRQENVDGSGNGDLVSKARLTFLGYWRMGKYRGSISKSQQRDQYHRVQGVAWLSGLRPLCWADGGAALLLLLISSLDGDQ